MKFSCFAELVRERGIPLKHLTKLPTLELTHYHVSTRAVANWSSTVLHFSGRVHAFVRMSDHRLIRRDNYHIVLEATYHILGRDVIEIVSGFLMFWYLVKCIASSTQCMDSGKYEMRDGIHM